MADILQFPPPARRRRPGPSRYRPLGNVRLDGLRRSPIDPGDALHALGLGTGIPHAEASQGALEAIGRLDLLEAEVKSIRQLLLGLLESNQDH